jgi:hypothetical protein
MANDDWRIRIDVEDVHDRLLERLGVELDDEARELAKELEGRRLAVSRDGDEIFVYAASQSEAEQALKVIESELRTLGVEAKTSKIEHWLEEQERWDDEPVGEGWEQEELDRGFAPWEVRIECPSRQAAGALAEQLDGEGYKPVRRFHYLIVGTATKEDAEALAARLHGEVEAGGEVVWEAQPQVRPSLPIFTIFGGLGT